MSELVRDLAKIIFYLMPVYAPGFLVGLAFTVGWYEGSLVAGIGLAFGVGALVMGGYYFLTRYDR